MTTMDARDPEIAEQVIVLLLNNATDAETTKIITAACRAGLMWRCTCRQANYLSNELCIECRETRPAVNA